MNALRYSRVAAGICLSFGAASALAAPVTLQFAASRDSTIFDEDVQAANGAGRHLHAGRVARGFERRALLAFDLGNAIPQGATLVAASLRLNVDLVASPGAVSFSLHRLTTAWGEGASDNSGLGQGADATTGDATWNSTFFDQPGAEWLTPGGDFVSTPSASAIVAGSGHVSWHSDTGLASGLLADIDAWRTTPTGNHGWLLKEDTAVARSVRRFSSRSSDIAANAPLLTVMYEPARTHVSAPATGALVGTLAALLPFCSRARRRPQSR
jgi:hypothetical protein